jgi:hypothetical protein
VKGTRAKNTNQRSNQLSFDIMTSADGITDHPTGNSYLLVDSDLLIHSYCLNYSSTSYLLMDSYSITCGVTAESLGETNLTVIHFDWYNTNVLGICLD